MIKTLIFLCSACCLVGPGCCAPSRIGDKFTNNPLSNLYQRKETEQSLSPFWSLVSRIKSRKTRQAALVCPTLSNLFANTNRKAGERSISPYIVFNNSVFGRFPQVIPDSRCNCTGCLDPSNPNVAQRENQSRAFSSELIRVPVDFFNRSTNKTYRDVINAGCTCIRPITRSL